MKHPELAKTFEAVADSGHEGFYKGRIAQCRSAIMSTGSRLMISAIVDLIQSQGGVMKLEDLAECEAEVIQPIKYEYKAKDGKDGVSLWEVSRIQLRRQRITQLIMSVVPTEWTRLDGFGGIGHHRGSREREGCGCAGSGAQLYSILARPYRSYALGIRGQLVFAPLRIIRTGDH